MARFEVTGLDKVQASIEKRSEAATKAIPSMLKAGAEVLVKAQKEQAAIMFTGDRSTGDLEHSIAAGKIKGNDVEKYVEVYPQGVDRHGVRNAEKAFVQEYGRKRMDARPYMSTANAKCGDEVSAAMRKEWEAAQNG